MLRCLGLSGSSYFARPRIGSCIARSRPAHPISQQQQCQRQLEWLQMMYLFVLAFLNCLVHGFNSVSGELCRNNELLLDVLDFLHHVCLELSERFLQRRAALQGSRWCLDCSTASILGRLGTQRFVYSVEAFGGQELVVEDVGPRIAPLSCGLLNLRNSQL
jgi:hypothetical protein